MHFLRSETGTMEVEDSKSDTGEEKARKKETLPEVDAYLFLLVIIFLVDSKNLSKAITASTALVEKIQNHSNRRTLSSLSSKAYFYYSRSYELNNRLEEIRR